MSAKDIHVAPIAPADANRLVRRLHYSGKVVPNSQLHFGVFLGGKLEGVMQYGPSMRKDLLRPLVAGTAWNGFLELNRLAFSDALPRNSESRALAVSMKLIRKHYPHISWAVSFADATQCGDGTIYRAAGFVLTQIKRNTQLRLDPATGELTQSMTAFHAGKSGDFHTWEPIPGYQFRYIYFLDPTARQRLTVPEIPFSDIPPECRMYLGQRASEAGDDPARGTAAVQR